MSNRSFHFANRLQTMISAIRAAPPRVLFLAVAVAVVGLMTVTDLPSASPVHAQEQAVTATRDATGESPPARPTDLQASAGPDSVSLTWTASTDQTVTHYAVLLRDRDEDDAGVFEVIDSNAGSATSYTDRSVSPGGSYVYRVKAVSPTGVSQWSSYARADIPADPEDLAPSGLSAKAVFDGGDSAGVALSWVAPAADAESVTGYEILRAVGDGDLTTLVADTGSADTTYADHTATKAGESYAYRVKALRGEETSQPSDRAVVTIPKVTTVDPEPRVAEEANGATAWVSNTAQTLSSARILLGNTDKSHSQGFTTGAETGGYSLGSVGVYVDDEDLESGETFTVHIYTADADGATDTLVHTLTSPDSYADDAVNLFTAPADATLAANTDYLVVFEATGNAANDFALGITASTSEDSGSATGWSIEDERRYENSLFGSPVFVISVNAEAEESAEVWSATLTVKSYGLGSLGCSNSSTVATCSANLSDTSFEYGGTTYSISHFFLRAAGTLELNLGTTPNTTTITNLTLNIGDSPFPLSTAVQNGSELSWPNSGLTLTADTDVAVSLTQEAAAPAVSSVDVTSDPGGDDTYAIGDTVQVMVTFDQVVTVDTSGGVPRIQLRVGGGEDEHLKWADYLSGTGAAVVQFTYVVQTGDFDDNGFYIAADELELNGGTIQSSGGTDANLDYPDQGTQSGHKVDGVRPTPEFAATSVDGSSIIIIFSETLSATTAPANAFTLSVDTGTAPAVSTSTASGNSVTLGLAGALTSDQVVTVAYVDATAGDAAAVIQDAAGNDAVNFTTGAGDVPAVVNAVGTGCSVTDGCYVVPADWGLIPTGLGAHDRFRLVFLSSTRRNAASTDIANYNTFVQGRAAAGHEDIQVYGSEFKVVGSTADVDARDNTATTYTADDKGVAIYWLGGNKVADDYEDFYDGDWDDEANAKDESGSDRSTSSFIVVLTGSNHDGTESFSSGQSRALGASNVRIAKLNDSALSSSGPLYAFQIENNTLLGPFYGLSPVFRVEGQVVTNTAPAFTTGAEFSTNENQVASFQVTAMDDDAGDEVSYAITGGADMLFFQINATNGLLAISVTFDHENPIDAGGNNTYMVTVTATGGTGARALSTDQAITVTVTDVDEPPSAPAAPTSSAVSGTTDSLSVTWTAPDNAGKPDISSYDLQYRKGTTGNFTDGPQDVTGTSATIGGLDAGELYQVQVRATNEDGDSAWSSAGTGATNAAANTAPAFTTGADFSTDENQRATFQVTAMDDDAGDEVSYAITGGADQTLFTIGATNGLLASATLPDHENPADADGNNVYQVTVTATGGTGARALSTDQAITVTVTDVDEPPSAPAAPTVSAVSDSSDSLSVTWTAPDNSGKPNISSYDLQYRKGDTGNFTDGPQDVTDTTTIIGGLDADSLYQVRVRATNDEGDSLWSSAGTGTTNALAGLCLLPTGRLWSACLTVGEISSAGQYGYQAVDSTGTLAPATFDVGTTTYTVTHLFDNDGLGGATYVQLVLTPAISEDDAGSLTLHLGDDTSLSFADATYATPPGGSGHRWSRAAALGWSTGDAIVVGITQEEPANADPSFLLESSTREVAENSAAGVDVGGPVTAIDTDTGDTLTYTLEGTDAASFTIVSTSGQIQTKAGVTYDHEAQPEYSVTVKADDGNGGTDTIAVTIDIADVDEPPSAPAEPTVSAVSGTTDSLEVTWTAPDNSGKPDIASYDLQYRKGTTGNWIDGPQDETGTSATIGGLDEDSAYQVQVRATNDEGDGAWSSPGSGSTNAPAQTPGVLTLGAPGGIYAIGKTLSVTVTFSAAVTVSGTPQLALDIGGEPRQADYESGTGTESLLFSYTVVEDDEDTDGIGVPADSLTLNGGTITAGGIAATLTHLLYGFGAVLVDGIRPTLLSAATSVDGTKVIATFSEDISSADHAEFNVGAAPIASATVAENVVTLALGFTILHGQSLILDVLTGAVQDAAGNGNDVVSQAITNNVPEPNAPPEFTSAASFSVAENRTAVGTVMATDDDAGDTVTYAITGGADQAKFDIDASSGELTFATAPDYEDPADSGRDNTYLVTVTATGGTGDRALTTDQAITVTVTDVDEPTDPTDADNLTATAHTGKIRLEWTGSADAYEFRRKEDGGAWSPWTAAETRGWFVLRNATRLDDYDVLALTAYTYQVRVAGDAGNLGEASATLGPPITLRLGDTKYRVDEGAGELFFTVLAETPAGLGRYDRDIRPSFTSAGVVGPLPEGPLVKTQEDYELLIESLRIEPGDFVLVNGMYVASRLRSVGIVDDTLVEGDETFELRLLLAGGVSRFFTLGAGDGRAEVTIVDNDQTSAEPATFAPLTGFELVDATAHLDAGAVEDGATLTGIDPAKLYGFRANVASGAELKSVRLELSGPGPDDRVARTDNDEPYALHGDSDGHEHGAALPAGSYTLTATAHSEKDGGGSELGTLSVEFTVMGEPLTARFEGMPEGTHGGAGMPFAFRISFSEAVTTTPEALRDHALDVTNATVEAASRVDDRSDLWEVRLTPETDAMVTVSLLPAADCDAAGAVCTEDGRMLSVGVARVILGPPPNSPATGQPTISGTAQVGQTLTADTSGIADADGLDNVTFSYQWMADDANIQGATGSTYTLADRDEGKAIKVIVSFTDDANNEESLPSAATDAVVALPGKPQSLAGKATAQEIQLTWKAPTGDTVVEYVVYRGILQNGSMNGQALSKYATIDAAGKAMTYTDDNVEEGVEYRYRVAAVNADGEGKKSTWLDITAE